MFNLYFQKIKELMDLVEKEEKENIERAADQIAHCIENGGIVHVFGSGHSHMLAEELFYRAGGLAPINPILIDRLMLHKGAVRSSELEKRNDYANQFMNQVNIQPKDVVIVVSTSGRNPVPIDVAEIAKSQGAFVIAISSSLYSYSQPSRHRSGKYLFQSADLAIDNHIEIGDALVRKENPEISYGAGSTVIGMMIINGIIVEAVEVMINNGFPPPIFKSGNIDGADEHNRKLINQYKSKISMLEQD